MTLSLSIKGRLILTICTVVLLSSVGMGGYSYRHQIGQLVERFETLALNENRLFYTILEADAQGLQRALAGLSRLEAFTAPFASRDRAALLAAAHPVFQEIKASFGITHMYFIAPDGTVLLRVHKPEQFGDRLQRETYRLAASARRTVSGLELGKNFFSLRCVTPVYSRGNLLGYLEIAEEIDHVFAQMKVVTGHDFTLFLANDYIRNHDTDVPPGTGGEFAVMYPTNRQLSLTFADQFRDFLREARTRFVMTTVGSGEERYAVGGGPVRDARGEIVGVLVSMDNVSAYYSAIWGGVLSSLAVFAAILVAGNFLLYLSMQKSLRMLHALRSHIQNVTRTWDLDRQLEVKTADEVGELAVDVNRMQGEISKLKSSLERQTEELKAANQELESFSYTLSHDLRSPLTRVSMAAEMIQDQYADQLDETGQLLLDNINKGCEGMEALIEAILVLANIVRKEPHYEKVDLAVMARDIGNELSLAAPERTVVLVAPEGLLCHGDRQMLKVALQNLLGNAWKYTGPVAQPRIEVGTVEQDGKRTFYVRDNGVGFDMQHAAKLFTPFKRLHDPAEFPGTGIGLATVQKIIQRHGGTIWASGKPGGGATFFFTLP